MTRFVADASIALAWVLQDESDEYAKEVLVSLKSSELIVPLHWSLEVGNGLLMAERRARTTSAETLRVLNWLATLPSHADPTMSDNSLRDTLSLARAHKLTVYDAGYLELCLRRSAPLATLDRNLRQACAACGVAPYRPA